MFRILWLDAAIDGLAAGYLPAAAAGLANRLSASAAEVDRLLVRDPLTAGESRAGAVRLLAVPLLAVDFQVFPDHMTVVVIAVRYVEPKRRR